MLSHNTGLSSMREKKTILRKNFHSKWFFNHSVTRCCRQHCCTLHWSAVPPHSKKVAGSIPGRGASLCGVWMFSSSPVSGRIVESSHRRTRLVLPRDAAGGVIDTILINVIPTAKGWNSAAGSGGHLLLWHMSCFNTTHKRQTLLGKKFGWRCLPHKWGKRTSTCSSGHCAWISTKTTLGRL